VTSGPIEPCPVDAVPGVLAAFAKAPLVALGEAHWLAEQAEFVARLIGHPAFPAVAGDIVVEFGNARYQELAGTTGSTDAPPARANRRAQLSMSSVQSSTASASQAMAPWLTNPFGSSKLAAAIRSNASSRAGVVSLISSSRCRPWTPAAEAPGPMCR
jgi:hypothetical protein